MHGEEVRASNVHAGVCGGRITALVEVTSLTHVYVEILHHTQIGQNAYTEYVRTIHINIYINKDNFPFYPQVWGSLTLTPITSLFY